MALAKDKGADSLQGQTYEDIGGYSAADIEFVVAFDVDRRKVGKTIGEAIFEKPNCCYSVYRDAACPGPVLSAPVLDGVAPHMLDAPEDASFRLAEVEPLARSDILAVLAEKQVDVLLNYLPVGSQAATEFWAEVCLEGRIAFCNCIPVFIASDPKWEARFVESHLGGKSITSSLAQQATVPTPLRPTTRCCLSTHTCLCSGWCGPVRCPPSRPLFSEPATNFAFIQ